MTELADVAARIVGWAGPGEQVEAYVARSRTTSIRAYNGEVESLSSAEPAGVGIRVVAGNRQGFAWAGTLDEGVLKDTLEDARDNVQFGQVDEYLGLPADDGVTPPGLDLVRPALVSMPTTAKVDMALELERRARGHDARVIGVRVASFTDNVSEIAISSTTGVAVSEATGVCYIAVNPLLEADGDTQSGYGMSAGREVDDLDVDRAVRDGVDRAARLLGATKPRSQRLTAVLDPDVTADLLSIIGGTLSGDAVLKGRSLFADRMDEAVAAPMVTLTSDPTDAAAFGAGEFDGEGLARRRVPLITGGVLGAFLYDTYSARRAGRASTASASRSYSSTPSVGAAALTLVPGTSSPAELIAAVGDGVYVQEVSGLHSGVNPVSGDFSVGATGLMIRDGAFAEPFREATIASTLQRMLLDIVAVGSDHEWLPSGPAGVTLVIRDVSLGGS